MKFKQSKEFDSYIEKYKKLKLEDKRSIIEKEFKETISLLDRINELAGIKSEVLINRELVDLNKEISSEDDFLEGVLVYITSIQELIAQLLLKEENK